MHVLTVLVAETAELLQRVHDVIAKAKKGELASPLPGKPDETAYLKQYAERLVSKLEDKVLEVEKVNTQLESTNKSLEARVAASTAELRKTVEKLLEANKELESFAYSVAHDLRAPLRAVRGLVTILQDENPSARTGRSAELCERLTHNADLMDRLIEDLLSYSRLGASQLTLSNVSLGNVASESVSLLSRIIEEAKAQVEVEGKMPNVIGHEQTLVHVVSNLISNGVKFVAPGVRPQVKVGAQTRNNRVRLTVKDNGIGILLYHKKLHVHA